MKTKSANLDRSPKSKKKQDDVIYSEASKNHERGRNIGQDCKTDLPTPRSILIRDAGAWLHGNRAGLTRPVIPVLQERFGLKASEAIDAIRMANAIRLGRAN